MELFTTFGGIAHKLQQLEMRMLGNALHRRDDLLDSIDNQKKRLIKFFAILKQIQHTHLDRPEQYR
jgi:hypothetical protein